MLRGLRVAVAGWMRWNEGLNEPVDGGVEWMDGWMDGWIDGSMGSMDWDARFFESTGWAGAYLG